MMETAQAQGFMSNAMSIQAAQLGKNYEIGDDKVRPTLFKATSTPHNNYMEQMMRDSADFMRTKGTGNYGNKFSRRGGYGNLDGYLALDTMNHTNSVWNKRKLRAFENYNTASVARSRRRKSRMAEAQRYQNQQFGNSPIGHSMM